MTVEELKRRISEPLPVLYHYHVKWHEDDEAYVATCEEFPGLSWIEHNKYDAMNGIESLVARVVKDIKENGS